MRRLCVGPLRVRKLGRFERLSDSQGANAFAARGMTVAPGRERAGGDVCAKKGCPRRVGARRGRKEGRYLGDTPSTCPYTAETPLHLAFIAPSPHLHSAAMPPSHCITGDVWQASLGVMWRMERGRDATLRARWAQSSHGLGERLSAREETAAVGISRHEKTHARQNRDTRRRRPVAEKSPRGGTAWHPGPVPHISEPTA